MNTIAAKIGAWVLAPFMVFGAHGQGVQNAWNNPASSTPPGSTSALTCTQLTNNLYYGLRDAGTGGQVTELQDFLRANGDMQSAATGNYGLTTLRGVLKFQRDEHISPTGYVGPQTRAMIESVSCGTTSVTPLSITAVDGPTSIATNTEGTWTVDVQSASSTNLHYSVKWGDENSGIFAALFRAEPVTQASATFTHTYGSAGTYAPEFTVTDDAGHQVSKTISVTVGASAPAAPTLSAVAPHAGVVGSTVTLTGTGFDGSTTVAIGSTAGSNVSLIDSTKLTFVVPSLATGSYNVMVTNGNGTSGAVTFTVVATTPALSIEGVDAPALLRVDQQGTWTVHTNLASTSGNLHYTVDWGDMGRAQPMVRGNAVIQTTGTFTHSYETAGTYTPKFTVTDDAGHTASVSASVVVRGIDIDDNR